MANTTHISNLVPNKNIFYIIISNSIHILYKNVIRQTCSSKFFPMIKNMLKL